ncbi:hypothetical protein [Haladaptatus pallidirubidus]
MSIVGVLLSEQVESVTERKDDVTVVRGDLVTGFDSVRPQIVKRSPARVLHMHFFRM